MGAPEDRDPGGPGLTHIDAEGNPHMVDVSGKAASARIAVAEGRIRMSAGTFAAIRHRMRFNSPPRWAVIRRRRNTAVMTSDS